MKNFSQDIDYIWLEFDIDKNQFMDQNTTKKFLDRVANAMSEQERVTFFKECDF